MARCIFAVRCATVLGFLLAETTIVYAYGGSHENTLFLKKNSGARCAGSSFADATTEETCHAAAVASDHAFFSFSANASTSKCITTASCDARDIAVDFAIYKRWLGSFNDTHADRSPASDGALSEDDKTVDSCKTQVSVVRDGTTHRNHVTCTSCKDDRSLAILFHASRAGACRPYKSTSELFCAKLNSDEGLNAESDQNKICTKTVESRVVLAVGSMSDTAKAHFSAVTGLEGKAVSRCRVRKEVICKGTGCSNRKQVKCIAACKLTGFGPPATYSNCDTSFCSGSYAHLLCQSSALLE